MIKNIGKNDTGIFIFEYLIALGFGFMLSGANIAGVSSFADISISGALGFQSSLAILTGSIIHSIISGTVGKNIVKIISMTLIIVAKFIYNFNEKPKICGILTGSSVFVSGVIVSILIGETWHKIPFYLFYGAFSGYVSYSASVSILGVKNRMVLDFSSNSGCAYAIIYTLFISSFCSTGLPFINLGVIIGSAVTLLSAYYYRCTGGVICGTLTVCGAFLASPEIGMNTVLLPVSSIIIGYLYKLKTGTSAGVFMVTNFALMILTGLTQNIINNVTNIFIGSLLFVIVAPYYSDKWIMTDSDSLKTIPDILNIRMNFISDSICSIRNDTQKISQLMKNPTKNNSDTIIKNVCCSCEKNKSCNNNIKNYSGRIAVLPEVSTELFPFDLSDCIHQNDIQSKLQTSQDNRMINSLNNLKTSESQSILFEQLKTSEEIIRSTGKKSNVRYSEPLCKQINEKLLRHGLFPKNVIAYYNSFNRLTAELYFDSEEIPSSYTRICDLVSDELGLTLELAEPTLTDVQVRIRLFEPPAYSLEIYGASMRAEDSNENGDTSTFFKDGNGNTYIMISDGMGSGNSAAVESRMVVRMFKKLIGSGIEPPSAIKLMNSIMFTKSNVESFATLDVVKVNLDTCELSIIKSGASATLIRHQGNVLKVTSPSFPIGINENAEFFSGSYPFEEGDTVIMFSDGISENEYLFIKELLLGGDDIKKIVSEICTKANVFNPDSKQDDITVIGIKVVKK